MGMWRKSWIAALALLAPGWSEAAFAATPAPRVVVVAVDGVGADELESHLGSGALEGGWARLARAPGGITPLTPAAVPLTAPGLASLVTGAPPAVHGVVGQVFRRPSDPLLEEADAASVTLPVETLWQAARRQKLQVGAVLWPGLDGSTAERRANWAVNDGGEPLFRSQTLVLKPDGWRNELYGIGPGPSLYWSLPPGVSSYSTPLTITLPFGTGQISGARILYDLIAIDRTDDGVANYDAVLIGSDVNPAKGYIGTMEPGKWFPLVLPTDAAAARSGGGLVCWLKVIDLDPVRGMSRIYASAVYENRAVPAALSRRLGDQNLTWPGVPDGTALGRRVFGMPLIDADTLGEQLDRLTEYAFRSATAGARLSWDLLLVHVPTFEVAARVAPSDRVLSQSLRERAWRTTDRELAGLLDALDLDRTTVVVVSSHGAVKVDAEVDVSEVLRQAPELASLRNAREPWNFAVAYRAVANEGVVQVYVNRQGASADGHLDAKAADAWAKGIARALEAFRFEGRPVFERVWDRKSAARHGVGGSTSGDVVAFARPGIRLVDRTADVLAAFRPPTLSFAGGYLPEERAMRGFYRELGRAARAPRRLRIEAIARRLAALLEIEPPRSAR